MNQSNIQFPFGARYFKSGEVTSTTKQLWYVLHGYGQLAEHFLKKFNVLENKDICLIAPEGLSHFYLEDLEKRVQSGNNRVGATWMTRENRDMDIANYITYLNTIHASETTQYQPPVTILGFSQGAATATRWALNGAVKFKRLVLWAGIFPPDMDFEAGRQRLKSKAVITVFGTEDPFVTPERTAEMKGLIEKLGIQPRAIQFEGKHEMDDSTVLDLALKF